MSALLIGCPPNQELICLIEKSCCSQYVFISLLSALNILILNCMVVSALPLQTGLILILNPDSTHGLFIGQVNAGVALAALFQRDARQHRTSIQMALGDSRRGRWQSLLKVRMFRFCIYIFEYSWNWFLRVVWGSDPESLFYMECSPSTIYWIVCPFPTDLQHHLC